MKKLVLSLLAFIPSLLFAQGSSILCEVSGNNLTAKSYLMGTPKFIGEKEFYLPEEATSRLMKCTVFTVEDQVDHHAQHELNKAVHFAKGKTLQSVMSKEDYERLVAFFQSEFGIDKKAFETHYARLKPLALSITMTRLSLKEKVKFYDIELLAVAKKNNLTTYSLESIEREAAALEKFPMEDQVKALLHSVDHFDVQKSEYQKLMADYPKGKLEEIFAYTLHPTENNPVFLEEFYYKRNEEWLPKIEKMMKENASFIALGISHLEADRGILQLLRSKGYILTPVPVQ